MKTRVSHLEYFDTPNAKSTFEEIVNQEIERLEKEFGSSFELVDVKFAITPGESDTYYPAQHALIVYKRRSAD